MKKEAASKQAPDLETFAVRAAQARSWLPAQFIATATGTSFLS